MHQVRYAKNTILVGGRMSYNFNGIYQDDVWVIMKGCVQWNPVYVMT